MKRGGTKQGYRAAMAKILAQHLALGRTVGVVRPDGTLEVRYPDGRVELREPPFSGSAPGA